MSQVETQGVLSEDIDDAISNDNGKLVPVGESIRYRRRAQSAEKRVQTLTEELAEARSQAAKMSEELGSIRTEQRLMHKLASAGVVDLDAGVIIAKAKMENETEEDINGLIELLKKEKRYLFEDTCRAVATKKTAGVKERVQNSQAILEKAARKAAVTGSRTDLQEYLKMRRNFL